jgi:hypothetical protein
MENRNDEQIIARMHWKVKALIEKSLFFRGPGLIRKPLAAHWGLSNYWLWYTSQPSKEIYLAIDRLSIAVVFHCDASGHCHRDSL